MVLGRIQERLADDFTYTNTGRAIPALVSTITIVTENATRIGIDTEVLQGFLVLGLSSALMAS